MKVFNVYCISMNILLFLYRKVLFEHPRLGGRVIDLLDLYNRVTSLGGYQKVSSYCSYCFAHLVDDL